MLRVALYLLKSDWTKQNIYQDTVENYGRFNRIQVLDYLNKALCISYLPNPHTIPHTFSFLCTHLLSWMGPPVTSALSPLSWRQSD